MSRNELPKASLREPSTETVIILFALFVFLIYGVNAAPCIVRCVAQGVSFKTCTSLCLVNPWAY